MTVRFLSLLVSATMLTPPAFAAAQNPSSADVERALEAARSAGQRAQEAAAAAQAAATAAQQAAAAASQARELAIQLGAPDSSVPPVPAVSAATQDGNFVAQNQAPVAGPVAKLISATSGMSFGFNGYIRTGLGANSKGGDQACFGLPGIVKYRLGNECDTFAEFQPSVTFPIGKDGISATYTFMIGYYNPNPMVFGGSENTGNFDVRQNWIGFSGFSGGLLEGATVWGGRRYYQRHDIHVQDFFYWSQRGQGVGVENVTTPLGKLSVALMRSYNNTGPSSVNFTNGAAGTSLDVRLAQIPTNRDGTLELGVELRGSTTQGDASAKDGFLLTAEHVQKVLGGSNKLILQYGRRAGANLSTNDPGAYFFTTDRTTAFRAIDQIVIEPNPNFSAYFGVIFQRDSNFRFNQRLIGRRDWLSIGARPEWHWSDHLTSAVEIGFDTIHYGNDAAGILSGKTARLLKVTAAPVTLKLGRGFFDRPELRLYGTCARWNGDADLASAESGRAGGSLTNNSNYAGQRSGCSAGAQIEAWW